MMRLTGAEARLRAGYLAEAEAGLAAARATAERHHLPRLLPGILRRLTGVALARGDLAAARRHERERAAACAELDEQPFEPDPFLLLAEARWDEAIAAATPALTTPGDEKVDKHAEIEALLVLAHAWHGKGDPARARDHLERARALMAETGCRRDRDRFADVAALLGADPTV